MFLEELLSGKHLIVSYYYSVNLSITFSIARELTRRGEKVCILNQEKIKWNLVPFSVDLTCDQGSVNMVFEADSENQVPPNYLLVTSIRELKLPDSRKFKVTKVDANSFLAIGEGTRFLFRLNHGVIEDVQERDDVIQILRELGGEATLQDLVNISSRKLRRSKEEIREELSHLVKIGRVEIKKSRVRLK
ncbi:hypothetical protein GWK48_03205 [Metallosphaera tengchongensis]|uniref:Uncharacterized protein n=1 Tax=Metallosphaera tengchongensis TaxID=1532350 RepID=A0A6N0NUG5_9CREN|nr:hypothetical protein [Metallosphaera tengchongensis]QKQ99532.1 hypothetical protein GWK48_03205 [Metallosphaera tengchongensis]